MELIRKIDLLNQHINTLLGQVDHLKRDDETNKLQLTEATTTISRISLELEHQAAEMDELKQTLHTLKLEHKEAAQNLATAVDDRATLSKTIEELNARQQQLTAELQQLRAKEEMQLSLHFGQEKEQEQLQAINEDLKEQLLASQQLNGELQEQLQQLRMHSKEQEARISDLSAANDTLTLEQNNLSGKYQFELSDLHSKVSALEEQRLRLIEESKVLSAQNGELTVKLEAKSGEMATYAAEVDRLKAELAENAPGTENFQLEQKVEVLEARVSNLLFENDLILKNQHLMKAEKPLTQAPPEPAPADKADDAKIAFLYAELEASRETNRQLEKRIGQYIEMMNARTTAPEMLAGEPKNAEEQNKIIKLAEAIEGNSVASNMELKVKLNEMIKEIDRCIAKLSS